ncbi:hypothetical protein QQ045_003682 [Rhodiola kirilowii]
MSSVASWNVRGLKHPSKQGEVKQLILKFGIGLLAVLEAKVSPSKCAAIAMKCCPNRSWRHYSFENVDRGHNRILLLWDSDVFDVNIWFACDQVIICEIIWGGKKFMAGFVYALNSQSERASLWDCLIDAMNRCKGPWLLSGDFNCIRFHCEKLNGARVRAADVRDLSSLCEDYGLSDIHSSGYFYTWSDRRIEGERIWCKLDRILVNDDLIQLFPNCHGVFSSPGISDHCPAISFLDRKPQWRSWFRFQSFWACTEEFKSCIVQKWKGGCWNLFLFQDSLKDLKQDIKIAMKDYRGDMCVRVEQCRQKLMESQKQLHLNPNDPELRRKEVEDLMSFRKILRYEHIFNCQRARISWAKEGDLNSKYFHSVIRGRQNRNSIKCVKLENDDFSFDPGVIKEQFVQFFNNLFNGQFARAPVDQSLFDLGARVKEEDCFSLVRDVSVNEVAAIVKNLPVCKAAGPNGFNSEFLKSSWGVVGNDLVNSVRSFLRSGIMPSGINSAYIALIPKVKNASRPCEFRPISCCNVVYKVVSILLANRLKPVLNYLIDHAQTAFGEGRNIAYNVSLVQELLCNYKRRNVSKRCMIKLDISKAYDMVDWNFLCEIMELYGFPDQFVKWIRACISSVKYSVVINGGMEGYFSSSRGIRQGDPISPYLFTLVMEVLSRLLRRESGSAGFKFHPKCARIRLTHLLFADDAIIFSKADLESLAKIKAALKLFYVWSGLKVSDEKSAIYFGGCRETEQRLMARAVGFQIGTLPFLYLGVPLDGCSLRGTQYNPIIDKMLSKIKSWSSRCLSYAGRLVLVKHVLSAIGSYWMRVLCFPKKVIKKITAICRNFLWSGNSVGKRSLVSWNDVCRPKVSGGLGVKDLGVFNKAIGLGQIWDLLLDKQSLWVKWMNSYYFKNSSLWEVEVKGHHSWVLKNILKLRDTVRTCIVAAGNNIGQWVGFYSVKESYELLQQPGSLMDGADMLWNSVSHPKHSFCSWLALRNRLPTKDNLIFLFPGETACCWCNSEEESIKHLFFNCTLVKPIHWFLRMIKINAVWDSFEGLIRWFKRRSWASLAEKNVAAFIVNAAIYESWRARNKRIFLGDNSTAEQLMHRIWNILRLKLELMKNTKSGSSCCNLLEGKGFDLLM